MLILFYKKLNFLLLCTLAAKEHSKTVILRSKFMTTERPACGDIGLKLANIIMNHDYYTKIARDYVNMWTNQEREKFMETHKQDRLAAMEAYLNRPSAISEVAGASYIWLERKGDTKKYDSASFDQLVNLFRVYGGKIPEKESDRIVMARSLAKIAARLMSPRIK